MKILDLYILKKFLITFLYTVILFVLVVSVIDFTEKNDDYIEGNIPYSLVFKEYYLNYFPYIANILSPIFIFIATVFVTSRLAARTEIIAMLNSGMSFNRLLLPFLMGATLIAGLTFYLIGWVIPEANKTRIAFENAYVKNPYNYDQENVHLKIAPETYAYMKSYSNQLRIGYEFSLETIKGHTLVSKLKADKITWDEERKKWVLNQYSIRKFDGDKEFLTRGTSLDTALNIHPEDFESTYRLHETFNMEELQAHIDKLQERGSEEVYIYITEQYERYTYPFAIIILTVIGVIVSARKSRQGTGYLIALGFLLAFIYILFVFMSRTFSQGGNMGPLVASWLPNIVFSFIGFIMYKTVPK